MSSFSIQRPWLATYQLHRHYTRYNLLGCLPRSLDPSSVYFHAGSLSPNHIGWCTPGSPAAFPASTASQESLGNVLCPCHRLLSPSLQTLGQFEPAAVALPPSLVFAALDAALWLPSRRLRSYFDDHGWQHIDCIVATLDPIC